MQFTDLGASSDFPQPGPSVRKHIIFPSDRLKSQVSKDMEYSPVYFLDMEFSPKFFSDMELSPLYFLDMEFSPLYSTSSTSHLDEGPGTRPGTSRSAPAWGCPPGGRPPRGAPGLPRPSSLTLSASASASHPPSPGSCRVPAKTRSDAE
eukprot:gene5523-4156_t